MEIRFNTRYLLIESVKEDSDMFYGYQANIAMSFYDEYCRVQAEKGAPLNRREIREVSNVAAFNFIKLWTRKG